MFESSTFGLHELNRVATESNAVEGHFDFFFFFFKIFDSKGAKSGEQAVPLSISV